MTQQCVKCSKMDRTNQHRLQPLYLPITYESSEIITNLSLPRKYTSTHNDETKEIYLSIGHQYNSILLSSEEAVKVQSQVVGKWVRSKDNNYSIHLTVLVSTEQNPQAAIRNLVFCKELGVVLEGIAFAETALLEKHPHLKSTKIYVHFKSIDPQYDRVEYWHRLGYWINPTTKPESPKKPRRPKIIEYIGERPNKKEPNRKETNRKEPNRKDIPKKYHRDLSFCRECQ